MTHEALDISVIIPFKNRAAMTLECLGSLVEFGPPVREILLVDNMSNPQDSAEIGAFCDMHSHMRVVSYDLPFNFQTVNNWAVRQTTGSFLLFLNNDTELTPQSRGLVERMYAKAAEPSVGAVGCLLLYGDKETIQHAGVFLISGGLADHVYVGESYQRVLQRAGGTHRYPYSIAESRPMTAVTAAACLLERSKFDEVGGFDERFILCGGDVDLCIRLAQAGYTTWFVSDGESYLLHKESQSRINKPVPFSDFLNSYRSYRRAYDFKIGDKFLPRLCEIHENRSA